MRLSDVLSRKPTKEYIQVDGFLQNKKGIAGQSVGITVGKVALNYFCKNCDDLRTFSSKNKIDVLFVDKKVISIDCILTCTVCGNSIPIWFLIECKDDITGQAPKVRILKKSEENIKIEETNNEYYNKYIELLNKAELAFNENLGAGAIVYLRKAFEKVTMDSAEAVKIEYDKYKNGNPKNFQQLLEKVDKKCSIIPREFTANGYKLFRELSDIVHGDNNEEDGIDKFEPLYRLVVGIIENIKNHKEIMESIKKLNWEIENEGK